MGERNRGEPEMRHASKARKTATSVGLAAMAATIAVGVSHAQVARPVQIVPPLRGSAFLPNNGFNPNLIAPTILNPALGTGVDRLLMFNGARPVTPGVIRP